MKKIGIVLAIALALTLVGCASSGGSSSGGGADLAPYSVDLSTLPLVKNANPFTQNWDDLLILFPAFPVDVTQYSRITINCKYYNAAGEEMPQSDSRVMVSLIYDPEGDIRGPAMGPGPNTPLKEMNVGGFSGLVNTDKGTRIRLKQAPGAILFQNNTLDVRFIEVTQITFHNKTASGE
ncbi:MAG: hypothetical protein LBI04_00285 [Treponema sp.]|jgi:hypothetical protein|nr:hypothetical protein [Treponema sp.]